MERYEWGNDKIRLRISQADLKNIGIEENDLAIFDSGTKNKLCNLLAELILRGELPDAPMSAEVFPVKSGVIIQITSHKDYSVFYLKDDDEMLAVYSDAKKRGASLFRRKDGQGYYLQTLQPESALLYLEFARPCRIPAGLLSEHCKRIL